MRESVSRVFAAFGEPDRCGPTSVGVGAKIAPDNNNKQQVSARSDHILECPTQVAAILDMHGIAQPKSCKKR